MDEDIFIPLVFFAFIAILVKMLLDYNKWKHQQAGSNSLGTGELRAMIKQAVEEANVPLQERLDGIEAQLERLEKPALPPADYGTLLKEDVHLAQKDPVERHGPAGGRRSA